MEPSLRTLKRLFALSRNRCAFPKCESPIVEDSGAVTGLVCHIKARSRGGPRYDPTQSDGERHSFENLLLLCARHSTIVDSDSFEYTDERLRSIKAAHEQTGTAELSQADARKAELLFEGYRNLHINAGGHVMIASPGAVQASNVVIKTQNKSVQLQPPPDSIAADLVRRNYIKHLIDRYNEFAKQQPGRSFQYFRIYKKIQSRFGAKWELVPVQRFDDLVVFLQEQVDRTMLGSINRSKGTRNYSTFVEYQHKYAAAAQ